LSGSAHNDAPAEFEIAIADGADAASAHTTDDFVL